MLELSYRYHLTLLSKYTKKLKDNSMILLYIWIGLIIISAIASLFSSSEETKSSTNSTQHPTITNPILDATREGSEAIRNGVRYVTQEINETLQQYDEKLQTKIEYRKQKEYVIKEHLRTRAQEEVELELYNMCANIYDHINDKASILRDMGVSEAEIDRILKPNRDKLESLKS